MSDQETAVALPGLGIAATVSSAYRAVFGQFWPLCKAAALPFFLSLVIGVLGVFVADTHVVLDIGVQLLSLLPLVIFGIAWGRIVLVGPRSGAIPKPLFGRRTGVYFGYILAHMLLIMLPIMGLVIAAVGTAFLTGGFAPGMELESGATQVLWLLPASFLLYLILLYFSARLALVFPAVTLDQKLGLLGSWRLTRGSGFKLYIAMILIVIPVIVSVMIGGAFLGGLVFTNLDQPGLSLITADGGLDLVTLALIAAPATIFSVVVQYVTFGLIVAAFAKAYAQLSGWGGPRQEVLERFE
ncbi:hypothetical protein HBA54_05220 [Pelagibius litoralis]|uniref:Uncharacterized protein n=1 Tax=Pelagibius litoralis TaxID=374515 RepID=A0A967EV06_9PROT|nr:hypothetical protein [Pelagibius litoralis]NIA67986.1 hypothetical protein [Pelagibius litoralis]